jgi:FKBP-type peptidyl-prolyl cis-trans isomerase
MPARSWKPWRARRTVTLAVGAGIVATGALAGWAAGPALASGHSPAGKGHHQAGHTGDHKHPARKLPVIGNPTNLDLEPVVHASKGKPPKKLEVKNLVAGTGATVNSSSTVSVVYVGANYRTGKDFTQTTWTSKRATTFPLSGVVRGFAEGLLGMKVGGRREIVIPPSLGYGDHNYGPIKAGETLVFVVDLKAVSG